MKKLIGGIVLILIIIGGGIGYKYYSDTYVTHTEYAKTPIEVPEKKQTKDANGKVVPGMYTYKYELNFFDETGKSQLRETEVRGEDVSPLPTNAIIKIETSEKRTSAPTVISESEVPKSILKKLN